MNLKHLMFGAALVVGTAVVTTLVTAEPAKSIKTSDKPAMPEMSPEQKEMMNKWMAYAMPSEHHKVLGVKEGKWSHHVKIWQAPDQTPGESHGTSEYQLIMDGRFLLDSSKGEIPNMGPFLGMGCTGYDNLKNKYVATWIDNMGTGIMVMEGTYDAASRTFTYWTESPDLMAGKYKKTRATETWTDDNHFTLAMFDRGADGKEWKTFEISYTRAQ